MQIRGMVGAALAGSVGWVLAQEPLLLSYYERAPYAVRQVDGSATGLTADVAAAALTQAGIPFQWQLIPAKRQIVEMLRASVPTCALGWYKTPERSQMGKFSDPIYHDKPTVGIARADFSPPGRTLAALVADPAVRILMKNGLTYGQDVPRILARAKAQVQVISSEQVTLARMVAANRADVMFSPQEEAQDLVVNAQRAGQRLQLLQFDDVTHGYARYIWCSKTVSDATMVRINQGIARVVKRDP